MAYGGGTDRHKLINENGRKFMEVTGEKYSTYYIFQGIQRGNASCVLGTVPHSEGLDKIFEFETLEESSIS